MGDELFGERGDYLREELQAVAAHRLAGLLPAAEPRASQPLRRYHG